jgi:quercetin dioxygenase-like cupin family protein
MCFTFLGEQKLVLIASDLAIYVLEGTVTLFWDSEKQEAVVGSFLYQPRATLHGFRVEANTPARILYLTVPAGCPCTIDRAS